MSKAVLVMDMPKACDDCRIRQINLARCQVTGKSTSHHSSGKPMDEKKRPDWCPLKPMPKKKIETILKKYSGHTGMLRKSTCLENKGWNACIDAICREEKAGDRD